MYTRTQIFFIAYVERRHAVEQLCSPINIYVYDGYSNTGNVRYLHIAFENISLVVCLSLPSR